MAKNDYCVIGLGRFGSEVAKQLELHGKNVMVIDHNNELIQKAAKYHKIAITCDSSNIDSLSETGITNIKTVIVAISDIESSIMTCANLKEIGVKDIIAKAMNPVHKRVLKTMGIPRVVIPEIEVAQKTALSCLYNSGNDLIGFGNGFTWLRMAVNSKAATNKSLGELGFRKRFEANIIMIQRKGKTIFPPEVTTKLEFGDLVTIICKAEKSKVISRFFGSSTISE